MGKLQLQTQGLSAVIIAAMVDSYPEKRQGKDQIGRRKHKPKKYQRTVARELKHNHQYKDQSNYLVYLPAGFESCPSRLSSAPTVSWFSS